MSILFWTTKAVKRKISKKRKMGFKSTVNPHKISFWLKISKKTTKPKIIYIIKRLRRRIALSSKMKSSIPQSRILAMQVNKKLAWLNILHVIKVKVISINRFVLSHPNLITLKIQHKINLKPNNYLTKINFITCHNRLIQIWNHRMPRISKSNFNLKQYHSHWIKIKKTWVN